MVHVGVATTHSKLPGACVHAPVALTVTATLVTIVIMTVKSSTASSDIAYANPLEAWRGEGARRPHSLLAHEFGRQSHASSDVATKTSDGLGGREPRLVRDMEPGHPEQHYTAIGGHGGMLPTSSDAKSDEFLRMPAIATPALPAPPAVVDGSKTVPGNKLTLKRATPPLLFSIPGTFPSS